MECFGDTDDSIGFLDEIFLIDSRIWGRVCTVDLSAGSLGPFAMESVFVGKRQRFRDGVFGVQ